MNRRRAARTTPTGGGRPSSRSPWVTQANGAANARPTPTSTPRYGAAAVRAASPPSPGCSATTAVGNGISAVHSSGLRFSSSSGPSTREDLGEDAVVVEPDHPDGQEAHQAAGVAGPLRPQGVGQRLAPADLGGWTSTTSRVMAMASTPSLKASSRDVVTVPTVLAPAHGPRHRRVRRYSVPPGNEGPVASRQGRGPGG
jgi:hypothetical protein